MAINKEDNELQSNTSWAHNIPWFDIALTENKFINDEFKYYKAIKNKFHK